ASASRRGEGGAGRPRRSRIWCPPKTGAGLFQLCATRCGSVDREGGGWFTPPEWVGVRADCALSLRGSRAIPRGIRSTSSSSRGRSHDPALRACLLERASQHAFRILARGDHHDRAAEAAACHPRANRAGCEYRFDDAGERRRRDLVVVAEARVARGEEWAKCLEIPAFECVDRLTHTLVLPPHVPHAPRVP